MYALVLYCMMCILGNVRDVCCGSWCVYLEGSEGGKEMGRAGWMGVGRKGEVRK